MTPQRASHYRLLERTVDIHGALSEAQYAEIHRLLGLPPGRFTTRPEGYLFDLTETCDVDRVLAYLREQRLAHTLAEERRWPADAMR